MTNAVVLMVVAVFMFVFNYRALLHKSSTHIKMAGDFMIISFSDYSGVVLEPLFGNCHSICDSYINQTDVSSAAVMFQLNIECYIV